MLDRHGASVRGPARLLRGWAAAVIATLLAAGSHTLAGGAHHGAGPDPVVWILTLALAGPLCTALAGRALSWGRLVAAVGSSQLLFHWTYSMAAVPPGPAGESALARVRSQDPHAAHGAHPASAGHGSPAGRPAPGAPAEPAAAADPVGSLAAGGAPLEATTSLADALPPSMVMVAAHVLAAVVTVFLLRRGELLAARVVDLALGLVLRSPGARLARWTPVMPVPRPPSRHLVPVVRRTAIVLSSLRLRGPPAPAFAS